METVCSILLHIFLGMFNSPFDVKLNDLSLYEFSGSSGSVSFLFSPGGTSKNAPDFLWFKLTFLEDGFRLNAAPSEKGQLYF